MKGLLKKKGKLRLEIGEMFRLGENKEGEIIGGKRGVVILPHSTSTGWERVVRKHRRFREVYLSDFRDEMAR